MSQDKQVDARLAQAIELAKVGERPRALGLIYQVLSEDPNNVTGLLWLAYLQDSVAEIELTLKRILEIDPTNQKAREWQALIRQKQAAVGPNRNAMPGPLAPTPPPDLRRRTTQPFEPLATLEDPAPTLNFSNWQQGMAVPEPAPRPLAQPAPPSVLMPDYNIREIQQSAPAGPVQIVIQMPDTSKNTANQNVPGWLIGVMVGLIVLLVVGIAYVLISQNGGVAAVGQPDKSTYMGIKSVDDLFNSNLESHQRVTMVLAFEGGYVTDATGNVKITAKTTDGKGTLIISWNPKTVPMSNFHSGQNVRVYGTVEGIGNTVTLNVEQADRA